MRSKQDFGMQKSPKIEISFSVHAYKELTPSATNEIEDN